MLECGRNFKGTLQETCVSCNTVDNEDHRLNHCVKYKPLTGKNEYMKFHLVYQDKVEVIRPILAIVGKVWNATSAHGTMRNCHDANN